MKPLKNRGAKLSTLRTVICVRWMDLVSYPRPNNGPLQVLPITAARQLQWEWPRICARIWPGKWLQAGFGTAVFSIHLYREVTQVTDNKLSQCTPYKVRHSNDGSCGVETQ